MGKKDESAFDEVMVTTVMNNLLSRIRGMNMLGNPNRDIYLECGFPNRVNISELKTFYEREPVAARVVELLPDECWKVQPEVYETEDTTNITPFEQAWKNICRQIEGEDSLYEDEKSNPVWEYLKKADTLSGIGQYGVILIGIDDGKDLMEAVDGFTDDGFTGNLSEEVKSKVIYIRCFDESLIQVTRWQNDTNNPRYGQPLEYSIQLTDPDNQITGIGVDYKQAKIHWSRVVHIADNTLSSEIIGVSRMRPVINNLISLQKLYSSSPEMYWQGAFPGIALTSDPQARIDPEGTKTQIQNYMNGLQRWLALRGMQANMLTPTVVDPNNQIEVQIDAICIKIGCPKRIFVGSERGELASSQDKDSWEERLIGRRQTHCKPKIIVPFINRLLQMGVLPKPEKYYVKWGEADNMTAFGKAAYAQQVVAVLSEFIQGGVSNLVDPEDFFVTFLGIDQTKAKELLSKTLGSGRTSINDVEPEDTNADVGSDVTDAIGSLTLTQNQKEFLRNKGINLE